MREANASDSQPDEEALRRRIAELESRLASTESTLSKVVAERDKLRHAYDRLKEQLELLRRRIYIAKAERVDATQLELEFAETRAAMKRLARELGVSETAQGGDTPGAPPKPRPKPTGRRDLGDADLPEERVEILDPVLEGRAERIGFEESYRLAYRRGGAIRLLVARAKYKVEGEGTDTTLVTADKPKELFERGMLAPSFIAHLLVAKYRYGMPFHRLSLMLKDEGVRLDDSTMCRYAEDAGATLGVIVDACAKEAKDNAFCLSTDATGVRIQPTPLVTGGRQPCAKGHFFVVLADKDHVFFEYQPKHTSAAVCEMFRGYSGYIQADASAVYDALFRGAAREDAEAPPPQEVGCWSHCRRHFWEAATATKDPRAREALLRIRALFELEARWISLPPRKRHAQRQLSSRKLVDDFFTWAEGHHESLRGTRTLVGSAFGYALRQREALRRFLDDGRLRLENNASERALRTIAVGRNSWLFFGSDDHATAAANLYSLIASCQLHGVEPEAYLADVIRVMPYWPRDRYLELAPKYWTRTRATLREDELTALFGAISVPPRTATEQEISSD